MAIFGELRIERDVEEAALPARIDPRHAGQRLSDLTGRRNEPQRPFLLGDEKPAVGQNGDAPGPLQPDGDGFDRDRALLALNRFSIGDGSEHNGGGDGDKRLQHGGAGSCSTTVERRSCPAGSLRGDNVPFIGARRQPRSSR